MSKPLWTSADIAKAVSGEASDDFNITGLSIDTRTIEAGDLFVPLKDIRDGHDFIPMAMEKGAGGALSEKPVEGNAVIVKDSLQALRDLGQTSVARSKALRIGVTGSVGKTSVKEALAHMFSAFGNAHKSLKSYNNHWGVPLTLARMPRETDFAVIEIGMNHPGEIAPLARQARPHVAMITTVAAAHLEAFDSIDDIAVEKAAILEGLETGGIAVLNADIDQFAILRDKAEAVGATCIDFGERAANYRLDDVTVQGEATVAKATVKGAPMVFKIATAGRHFAMNGLGALAVCDALGADPALSVLSLGRWSPYRGRGVREQIRLDPAEPDKVLTLLDDAYNANPTSMAAALAVLDGSDVGTGRRIAILGDMKELGANATDLHADLARLPALQNADLVLTVGPLMRALHNALPPHVRGGHFDSSDALLAELKGRFGSADTVLVKGSLSMNLGQVVDAIRKMGHGTHRFETQDNE